MDELGKSFPVAEGMVDAEQSGKPKQHNEYCLNCGTKLQDIFCHHCGQKDLPKRQTLGELLTNFISSFWSYEGKFFLTAKYLLTRPGFLAKEYSEGKRESYYHPARMYVFISFVFFLTLVLVPDSNKEEEMKDISKADAKEVNRELKEAGLDTITNNQGLNNIISKAVADSVRKDMEKEGVFTKAKKKKNASDFSFSGPPFSSIKEYDSAQNILPDEKRDGWIVRKLNSRAIEINKRYEGDDAGKRFGKDFGQAFIDNFSKVLFYLLPVFALLLKSLYMRRDFFYSEHLVFSIYYYNFFFIAGTLYMIVNLIPGLDWLTYFIVIWIMAYLLWAMKRTYQQSWRKTILKYSIFSFLFLICMSIGVSISALLILFWI